MSLEKISFTKSGGERGRILRAAKQKLKKKQEELEKIRHLVADTGKQVRLMHEIEELKRIIRSLENMEF